MHLAEVIALRPVPAAGLIIELTRRCPLSCAHCSTDSTMGSEEQSGDAVLRLVDTFSSNDRPEVIALTGGEPLLRPRLVTELTCRAHQVDTRVHILTGMFFATSRTLPPAIRNALTSVDHVSASLDRFHEREIPRAAVFRVFDQLLERGKHVSFQVVGIEGSDPYLDGLVNDVRRVFNDRVPLLVSGLRPEGRAKAWLSSDGAKGGTGPVEPSPCTMAAWPVVCADGRVMACCNQAVVDGTAPQHLRLGHAFVDPWPMLRAKCQSEVMLRGIRVLGPTFLATEFGLDACNGYCGTCHRLADHTDLAEQLQVALRPTLLRTMDEYVAKAQRAAGAVRFVERFGMPQYASLVKLGYEEKKACPAL